MRTAGSHLTYCTNIHAGESWAEVRANIETHVLAVKRRVCPERDFGVGLRLSARAGRELARPAELERFKDFLAAHGLYVFTINGFPYGPFHGEPVKEAVYRPDWSEDARTLYTAELAHVLSELLPAGQSGSISTVPGGFKSALTGADRLAAVARQLLASAEALHRIERERGQHIVLALEPEPCCLLETSDEVVAFFRDHLLSSSARAELAQRLGVDHAAAEAVVYRHLGVCLDTCHAAVEFEGPQAAVNALLGAGLNIAKVQLSAGLRLPELSPDALRALGAYVEPVYLHQVVARTKEGALLRYVDLPDALASSEALAAEEWRVHFHVPLYRERLERFVNTQPFLSSILELQRRAPFSEQLEVETYTWDVLPPEQRSGGVVASIARELDWVREQLV
ncbi:MAG: metabolite traffic protein EboE [Polyangiaceae bacterium]